VIDLGTERSPDAVEIDVDDALPVGFVEVAGRFLCAADPSVVDRIVGTSRASLRELC